MTEYTLIFENKKKSCGCRLYSGSSPLSLAACAGLIKQQEAKGAKLITVLEVVDVVDIDRFADMIYDHECEEATNEKV